MKGFELLEQRAPAKQTGTLTPMAKLEGKSDYPLRWLGIDFSGDVRKWSPGCSTSNVWIAEVVEQGRGLRLDKLGRVQTLPGLEPPFERLASRLRATDFCAAAIDAPFSVPADFIPAQGHDELLALVRRISQESRPFPEALTFADAVIKGRAMLNRKPLRHTECEWGVNVRSALWTGPRGGAAMTSACLALLSAINRQLWPWCQYPEGIIAEAFPAAQLKKWQLPHQQYSDSKKTALSISNRQRITEALKQRIVLGDFESQVLCSADALDAVLCAFAAIAITRDTFVPIPSGYPREEGWIAVQF